MTSSTPDLSTYEAQLNALGRFLQTMHEGATAESLLEATLHYLKTEFAAPFIWMGLYDPQAQVFSGVGGVLPSSDSNVLRQRFSLYPGDLLEQIVVHLKPIGVQDLQTEVRSVELRKLVQRFQLQGGAFFPIRHRDRCWGVVILGWQHWGLSLRSDEVTRLSIALKELAACLDQLEQIQHRQHAKQADGPLVQLMAKVRATPQSDQQLAAVVAETHRFMSASKTCIYEFDAKRRSFCLRLSYPQKTSDSSNAQASVMIPAHEVNSVYQELVHDCLVVLDRSTGSQHAEVIHPVLWRDKTQALLIAPIFQQREFQGFLGVESEQPRLWQEAEKLYLRGAAHLVALITPPEGIATKVQQTQSDLEIVSRLQQALGQPGSWQTILRTWAVQFCQHLQVERLLLLQFHQEPGEFEVAYQTETRNRRLLPRYLGELSQLDWELLEQSRDPLRIENWPDDLRLLNWRSTGLEVGIKALLVVRLECKGKLEGLLAIAQATPRTWTRAEIDLVKRISPSLGSMLHQGRLEGENAQTNSLLQTLQGGLTALQQHQSVEQLDQAAVQLIAQTCQAPYAALISWTLGAAVGQLGAIYSLQAQPIPAPCSEVPLEDDLIQQALLHQGPVFWGTAQLLMESHSWLNLANLQQVWAVALRTAPEHEPTAILVIADVAPQDWQGHGVETLMNQFAWFRRQLLLTTQFKAQQETLERLNWYKLRKLEAFGQAIAASVKRLQELEAPTTPGVAQELANILKRRHYQESMQQLDQTAAAIAALLQQEPWQLRDQDETLLLSSLLKRALEYIEPLTQKRRLWAQLQSLPTGSPTTLGNLQLQGDVSKMELVLCELLTSACLRSPDQGRVDLWPSLPKRGWLELSITDSGTLEPALLAELARDRPADLLVPSLLDQPPGLSLKICQFFVQQFHGGLSFYQLEDGRTLTRLVLPVHLATP